MNCEKCGKQLKFYDKLLIVQRGFIDKNGEVMSEIPYRVLCEDCGKEVAES